MIKMIVMALSGLLLGCYGSRENSDIPLVYNNPGVFVEQQKSGSKIFKLSTGSNSSNIYCEIPYCTPNGEWLVYERDGAASSPNPIEFVRYNLHTGREEVIGESIGIAGSALTEDGLFYFVKKGTTQDSLYCVDLLHGDIQEVHRFTGYQGLWGLGTVSIDHHFYVRGVRLDDAFQLFGILLVDLNTGEEKIIDQDPYTWNPHPQFNPANADQLLIQHNRGSKFDAQGNLLQAVGPEGATLYLLSASTCKRTLLPVGLPYTTPITGHQAWASHTGNILLTVTADGDYAPDKGNILELQPSQLSTIVGAGWIANHISPARSGPYYVVDDWQDPYKVVIGNSLTGKTVVLCDTFTVLGTTLNTQPSPYLTPDLRWVIFNSTRSGSSQVYAASLPPDFLADLQ
jgi:hypothetical protein